VAPFGVEPVVSVSYSAKQKGHSLFQEGQLWGKPGLGYLMVLWTRNSDGPRFTLQTTHHASSEDSLPFFELSAIWPRWLRTRLASRPVAPDVCKRGRTPVETSVAVTDRGMALNV
jgi:hypothetical protein